MSDPYEKLLDFMRNQGKYYNSVPPDVGKVLSVDPLRIVFQNIPLDSDDLKVNKALVTLEGYTFEKDSEVLIFPAAKNFIVVCEVV